MNIRRFVIVPAALLLIGGCAGTNEQTRTIERLNARIIDLQSSIYETNSKVEELNTKFLILIEKVEADRKRIERARRDAGEPPEGLRVVRLGEEQTEPQPVRTTAKTEVNAAESPDRLYNRGQNLFMAGRYKEARSFFKAMAKDHPDHHLADNALYWIGEAYYTEKRFSKALAAFKELVEKYPKGNKAPDAFLKIGFSYIELNKKAEAKAALLTLLKRYPGTEAAFKAQKRLKDL